MRGFYFKGISLMVYIFDTNSFQVLSHYYPENFPTVWDNIELLIEEGRFISAREVLKELENGGANQNQFILNWIKSHKKIFLTPTTDEMIFVSQIFKVQHFQQLVGAKQRLKGTPVADPFIIACAKIRGGCVITEEVLKENSAKIPNICKHFEIDCTNVEGFMKREKWKF